MTKFLTTPATLELLAEECSELSQAALKLARKYRGENPTPKTEMECIDSLTEEVADIMTVLDQLEDLIDINRVEAVYEQKMTRWRLRMGDGNGDKGRNQMSQMWKKNKGV